MLSVSSKVNVMKFVLANDFVGYYLQQFYMKI